MWVVEQIGQGAGWHLTQQTFVATRHLVFCKSPEHATSETQKDQRLPSLSAVQDHSFTITDMFNQMTVVLHIILVIRIEKAGKGERNNVYVVILLLPSAAERLNQQQAALRRNENVLRAPLNPQICLMCSTRVMIVSTSVHLLLCPRPQSVAEVCFVARFFNQQCDSITGTNCMELLRTGQCCQVDRMKWNIS